MAKEMKLFIGYDLRSAGDKLSPIQLQDLVDCIRSDTRLKADTASLRELLRLDPRSYKRMKLSLPYFCVSEFKGGVRRTENFLSASMLPFDVDWGATDQREGARFRQRMYDDPRCMLGYISPSGTNWRVVYALSEPILDAAVYRAVYKRMASQLQEDFLGLRGLDSVTHDPTRANFLAFDRQVYSNSNAENIDWRSWRDSLRCYVPNFPFCSSSNGPDERNVPDKNEVKHSKPLHTPYGAIRKTLQPERKGNVFTSAGKTQAHVPMEVLALIPAWAAALKSHGFRAVEEKPIPYGIQVLARGKGSQAMINITYGKKGFRFVPVGKRGTDQTLAKELAGVLEDESYGHGTFPPNLPELAQKPSFLDTTCQVMEEKKKSEQLRLPGEGARLNGPWESEPEDFPTQEPPRALEDDNLYPW